MKKVLLLGLALMIIGAIIGILTKGGQGPDVVVWVGFGVLVMGCTLVSIFIGWKVYTWTPGKYNNIAK